MSARALGPGRAPFGRTEVIVALAVPAVAAAATVALGPAALALPVLAAGVAFFLREPTALLALYLEIGLFKSQPAVSALPIDATLALGVLVALVCGVRLVTGRVRAV